MAAVIDGEDALEARAARHCVGRHQQPLAERLRLAQDLRAGAARREDHLGVLDDLLLLPLVAAVGGLEGHPKRSPKASAAAVTRCRPS